MVLDFLLSLGILGALAASVVGLAMTLFRRTRRTGARMVLGGLGVVVLGTLALGSRDEGGSAPPVAELAAVTASEPPEDEAARAERERQERSRIREAERAERAAAAAERRREAELEDEACLRSLECAGERASLPSITTQCERALPHLAQYEFEFTDGWLEPKFSHYRWRDQSGGIVTIIGGRARAQNGFGAWSPIVYECDVDVLGERIVDARMREGRL